MEMKVLAILFALCAVASAKRFFHNDQVLRIQPTQEYQFKVIETLEDYFPVNYWTEPQGSRPVDIHVAKNYVDRVKVYLKRNKIDFEVFIDDLQKSLDEQVSDRALQLSLSTFDYNVYHTLEEIQQWMADMESTYSTVSRQNFGKTFEGRDLIALKISKGGNKPAFIIDCGLHPREWVAPASCLYAVKYLVEAQIGSEENSLLNSIDIYVIPIANPDGYVYTWTSDRMWRKTRSTGNGGFCDGVDPNRNWDINWSGEGGSGSSCSDLYYGPSVFSEVEVRNQRDFISSIANVQGYIDLHAYYQYWMFPYAYTYGTCADDTLLRAIGTKSVQAIKAVHGATYQSGSISEVIYVASGSTSDYVYEKLGVKCTFAAELRDTGRYGFTLPERFIQPTAEETFAGLKVIASYVADGSCA